MPDLTTVGLVTVVGPLAERTSSVYTATLVDQNGIPVPAASLLTLTLTLKEARSGAVVNGRNAQNVLNANNVTVDNAGLLTWQIQPADLALVNNRVGQEFHRAVFHGTWAGGGEFTKTLALAIAAAG